MFSSAMLESFKSQCQLLRVSQDTDDEGGQNSQYEEVQTFEGLFGFKSSTQALAAEKQGVTSLYVIYVPRDIDVEFHDVIRRLSDGMTFRVTHPGKDVKTPVTSFIDWKKINAEEWVMPDD